MDIAERMKGIDPLDVLRKCKKFLGRAWERVEESNFQLTPLTQGFGNRLMVCRPKDNSTIRVTPEKVLVRFYGGNFLPPNIPGRVLSEAAEVLVFYAWGSSGYGPKLLGVFEGGRIEEFIESRLLTTEEFANDVNISDGIAKVMARYHTQKIPAPFPCSASDTSEMRGNYDKFLGIRDKVPRPEPMSKLHKTSVDDFLNFDVIRECEWIEKVAPQIESRIVFTHNDANRGNVLFRLKETDEDGYVIPIERRLVLVDYEFSGYRHRGWDISKHFCTRVYDFGQTIWLTKKEYPTEERRRQFIRTYLGKCKELGTFEDWDEGGRDSEDNVLLETDFFQMVSRLSSLAWLLGDLELYYKMSLSRLALDPEFEELGGMGSLNKFYSERKADFLARYPQFDV